MKGINEIAVLELIKQIKGNYGILKRFYYKDYVDGDVHKEVSHLAKVKLIAKKELYGKSLPVEKSPDYSSVKREDEIDSFIESLLAMIKRKQRAGKEAIVVTLEYEDGSLEQKKLVIAID